MRISRVTEADLGAGEGYDGDVRLTTLLDKIAMGEVFGAWEDDPETGSEVMVGYLRYSLFWDEAPFVNLLKVGEPYRNAGRGTELVSAWEDVMRKKGSARVMASAEADNDGARAFFAKLGYREIGRFRFPGQTEEVVMLLKELGEETSR